MMLNTVPTKAMQGQHPASSPRPVQRHCAPFTQVTGCPYASLVCSDAACKGLRRSLHSVRCMPTADLPSGIAGHSELPALAGSAPAAAFGSAAPAPAHTPPPRPPFWDAGAPARQRRCCPRPAGSSTLPPPLLPLPPRLRSRQRGRVHGRLCTQQVALASYGTQRACFVRTDQRARLRCWNPLSGLCQAALLRPAVMCWPAACGCCGSCRCQSTVQNEHHGARRSWCWVADGGRARPAGCQHVGGLSSTDPPAGRAARKHAAGLPGEHQAARHVVGHPASCLRVEVRSGWTTQRLLQLRWKV
jgi:hypothetical protein